MKRATSSTPRTASPAGSRPKSSDVRPKGSGRTSRHAASVEPSTGAKANASRVSGRPSRRGGTTVSALAEACDFGALRQMVPHSQGFVVTTLPRGGLQLAQPRGLPESIQKPYARRGHTLDVLSWSVLRDNRARRGEDIEPATLFRAYHEEVLTGARLGPAAAAAIDAPLIAGYPGAIHVYRLSDDDPFSASDVKRLSDFARDVSDKLSHARSDSGGSCLPAERVMRHDLSTRLMVIDRKLSFVFPAGGADMLQERLRANLFDFARHQFRYADSPTTPSPAGPTVTSGRVTLAGERGDFWTFRSTLVHDYPALGGGPLLFVGLQPHCDEWATLRPGDFHADEEVSRLMPALRFMADRFAEGPGLPEIAKTVGLSPFHFHRRFTELLGTTPKHFLFDCQIEEAKRRLVRRDLDLIEIADRCGFAHQSHFTSRFKQSTGLTPTRWRRVALSETLPGDGPEAEDEGVRPSDTATSGLDATIRA